MEAIGKQAAEHSACIFRETQRVHVESEGVLPDYCDDIHKIIRQETHARILTKKVYVSEGKLIAEVGGEAAFTLIYRGEDAGEVTEVASQSFTEPFTARFEVPSSSSSWEGEAPELYHFPVTCTVESALSRALGKKKASLSATLALGAELFVNRAFSYFAAPQEGIEAKTVKVTDTVLSSVVGEEYRVEEEIPLPPSAPPIFRLLDCDVRLAPAWVRPQENEIAFGLSAVLSFAYFSEEEEGEKGRLCSFSQPMELSEVLSAPGVTAESVPEFSLFSENLKAEVLMDSFGARKSMRIQFTYTASAAVFEKTEPELCEDAFCLNGGCELTYGEAAGEVLLGEELLRAEEQVEIPLPRELCAIENTGAEFFPDTVALRPEGLFTEGEVRLTGLGVRAEDGRIVPVEESCRLSLTFRLKTDLSAVQGEVNARLSGGIRSALVVKLGEQSSVRLSFAFLARLTLPRTLRYVADFLAVEDGKAPFSGVRFRYPAEGDTLWSIAKQNRVSLAALKEENGIVDDAHLPPVLRIVK